MISVNAVTRQNFKSFSSTFTHTYSKIFGILLSRLLLLLIIIIIYLLLLIIFQENRLWWKRLGLDIEHDVGVKTAMKSLFALALLPADRVRQAFAFARDSQTPAYAITMAGLFEYFEEIWINIVTPERFSMYGGYEAITDCTIASLDVLQNVMVASQFPPWNFIGEWCFVRFIFAFFHDNVTSQGMIVEVHPSHSVAFRFQDNLWIIS